MKLRWLAFAVGLALVLWLVLIGAICLAVYS